MPIKITSNNVAPDVHIPMFNMKPLQVAVTISKTPEIVMRTASTFHFEVISLSDPEVDNCWTAPVPELMVRLLRPEEFVTLVVRNLEEEDQK